MAHSYAVQVTESDGSRRRFEHTRGERLRVGEAIEDREQDATYIVASISESDVEALFSFAGTWPEAAFELHALAL